MSPRLKKSLRIAIWAAGVLIILFAAGEITLRLVGFRPWLPENKTAQITPGGSLFQRDDSLGYSLRPGKFQITLDSTLTFTATHDAMGRRIHATRRDDLAKPEIWIFGCSFTYGWGVNDAECWPAVLADSLYEYKVVNFAVPAYGTAHAWLQLRDALSSGKRPVMVVIAYGGFHNQRNVCGRLWKKALSGQRVMEGILYPYIQWDGEQEFSTAYSKLDYHPWPLMRASAFIHFLEQKYGEAEESSLGGFEVTRELMFRMKLMTEEIGARFLVAGIWRNESTTQMLETLRNAGLPAIDLSVGDGPGLTILPNDAHPSAKAHRIMAKNFLEMARLPVLF